MKDLLKTSDLNSVQLENLINLSLEFKQNPTKQKNYLNNKTIILYFNKPSTRTRLSAETAITRLGGMPISVGPNDLQLGRGETIEDTAKVMSRYAKAFIIRTFSDEDVKRFANAASIPVINALTDLHHPLQSLADLMTLREKFGDLRKIKLAYVGDGNNVAHSLMEAAALCGMSMSIATPEKYRPSEDIINATKTKIFSDPIEAVSGADAVYTDVWVSMGTPETERAERIKLLEPYQVNNKLMFYASKKAVFMHCLPAHRGEEVSADVMDGPQSIVFDQAENRLHTVQAVLSVLC